MREGEELASDKLTRNKDKRALVNRSVNYSSKCCVMYLLVAAPFYKYLSYLFLPSNCCCCCCLRATKSSRSSLESVLVGAMQFARNGEIPDDNKRPRNLINKPLEVLSVASFRFPLDSTTQSTEHLPHISNAFTQFALWSGR